MPTYSLWLEPGPHGPVRLILGQAIQMASSMGSRGPTFPPHITLAGSVNLPSDAAAAAAAGAVAARLPAPGGISIGFRAVDLGHIYHQAVMLMAEPTPELVAAAAAARAAAAERWSTGGAGPPAPGPGDEAKAAAAYLPHASLLYTDDVDTRVQAVCEAVQGGQLSTLLRSAGVNLEDPAASTAHPWTRVTAWRTEGPVEGWTCVADVGVGEG